MWYFCLLKVLGVDDECLIWLVVGYNNYDVIVGVWFNWLIGRMFWYWDDKGDIDYLM